MPRAAVTTSGTDSCRMFMTSIQSKAGVDQEQDEEHG